MTTILDEVAQDYEPSPRVTVVLAPRTAFVAQDVVDTLRKVEDSWAGMSNTRLLTAAGKQDLGDGRFVGITYALQDNQVQFEDRQTPAQTGVVTTASGASVAGKITVTDTSATFVTNLVKRGSFIVNWTDQSIVSVHDVIDENNLRVKVPTSGLGNTYEISDAYSVFNVVQVQLGGGNPTAVDDLLASIDAAVPSVGTYLTIALSTNAGLVEGSGGLLPAELLMVEQIHGQGHSAVYLNTEALVNGNGYQQTPWDNFSDAIDDAESLNLLTIHLQADATVDRNISNFKIIGLNLPTVDLGGFDYKNGIFSELTITGTQGTGNSPLLALTCAVLGITNFNGSMLTVTVVGTISIADGAFCLINGVIPAVGGVPWTLDMGATGAASTVQIQNISGGLIVTNMDNAGDAAHFAFHQGSITIDATCTAGNIVVSGSVKVTDNSGAGCTVDLTATGGYLGLEELVADHVTPGTFGEWIGKKLLTVSKFIGLK